MFKKIKSLFIVEQEPDSTSDEQKSAKQDTSITEVASKSFSEVNMKQVTVSKQGVDKFVNLLLKALDEAGQDGFDYLEFKNSIKSLSKISMDEATKYQSALAMAKTMGADGTSLESSAKHYLSVLANEKQKINDAYTEKISKDKTESEDKFKQLNDALRQKTQQLKKLEEELIMHKAELEKLEKEKKRAEQKANAIKSEFDQAFHLISGQISEDLEKLEKYLKLLHE